MGSLVHQQMHRATLVIRGDSVNSCIGLEPARHRPGYYTVVNYETC